MQTFALAGMQVGSKVVAAIRKAAAKEAVSLECGGARFLAALELTDVEFEKLDLTNAIFDHGIRLRRITCAGSVSFDRVTTTDLVIEDAAVQGDAGFRDVRAGNLTIRDAKFARYASFDECETGMVSLRDVDFAAEARFRGFVSRGQANLRSVRFGAAASLQRARFAELSFYSCEFRGPLQTADLEVAGKLALVGASLDDTRALDLRAGGEVSLRQTNFAQPLALTARSPILEASGASFERGADLLLEPRSRGRFADTSFLGPSLIGTREGESEPPARLELMDRARVERLTLQNLDLSECRFSRLHRLDDVLISGRGQLQLAPAVVDGSYRREVLADEVVRRADNAGGMLGWAPITWSKPPRLANDPALEAPTIAEVYRAMRKAREDSRDHPGAADFYYGEMEMRREGADNWVERLILTLYWAVSGYGLRAGRAAAVLVLSLLLLAAGFQEFGLEDPSRFTDTLGWTLAASVSLVKPIEPPDLTTAGIYLAVAARILGPALIAMMLFALRSRVRR